MLCCSHAVAHNCPKDEAVFSLGYEDWDALRPYHMANRLHPKQVASVTVVGALTHSSRFAANDIVICYCMVWHAIARSSMIFAPLVNVSRALQLCDRNTHTGWSAASTLRGPSMSTSPPAPSRTVSVWNRDSTSLRLIGVCRHRNPCHIGEHEGPGCPRNRFL
jgi:hypothetical protein